MTHALYVTEGYGIPGEGETLEIGPYVFCSEKCRQNMVKQIEGNGGEYRLDVIDIKVIKHSYCDLCGKDLE